MGRYDFSGFGEAEGVLHKSFTYYNALDALNDILEGNEPDFEKLETLANELGGIHEVPDELTGTLVMHIVKNLFGAYPQTLEELYERAEQVSTMLIQPIQSDQISAIATALVLTGQAAMRAQEEISGIDKPYQSDLITLDGCMGGSCSRDTYRFEMDRWNSAFERPALHQALEAYQKLTKEQEKT